MFSFHSFDHFKFINWKNPLKTFTKLHQPRSGIEKKHKKPSALHFTSSTQMHLLFHHSFVERLSCERVSRGMECWMLIIVKQPIKPQGKRRQWKTKQHMRVEKERRLWCIYGTQLLSDVELQSCLALTSDSLVKEWRRKRFCGCLFRTGSWSCGPDRMGCGTTEKLV